MSILKKPKIIVICGPTATGKSDYAVKLALRLRSGPSAKKINGEIISADSRQVYRGLDIGSGKITQKEMRGIPHHLIDVASPKKIFSVAQYKKLADIAIKKIIKKSKIPIICGGTGFYIDTVINGTIFPEVKADKKLREKLSRNSAIANFRELQKLDPERAKSIDSKNNVRIIRAIEIALVLGKVPKIKKSKKYDVEYIYLDFPDEILKKRIHDRLMKRMKTGMMGEITNLHNEGVSWKRLEMLGLEYRYIALFLQNKISKQEMLETLEKEIWAFAKRQRTWFKKHTK